jgi:putative FmdB family regulatory protein
VPIYEYECNKCHQITEALQKFSDPAPNTCPHCRGKLKKLMSLNSFHLKGSGWYVTDYAGKQAGTQPNKNASEASGKDEKASKSEKSGSSTKSASES